MRARPSSSSLSVSALCCASLAVAAGACGSSATPLGSAGLGGGSASDDGGLTVIDDGGTSGGFISDGAVHTMPVGVDAGCATATVSAKAQPAYLLFVQDASDSMNQENKWAAVVPALEAIFAQMETAADPGIAAGLIMFPGSGGPYPASIDVPLAFVDSTQQMALDARFAAGLALGTPTEAALTGGYGELESFQPKSPLRSGGKKVLILLTDGLPTDACANVLGLGDAATNPCVSLAASKLTEATSTGGPIETFVIGVGDYPSTDRTQFDPVFLGNLAKAGGTSPAGCNPNETASTSDLCYFEIDPSKSQTAADLQKQFTTALDTIRGKVVSCSFPIQSNGLGQADPTKVNVEIGGKVVPQNATNGWTYDNPSSPTEITLHGTSCASAMVTAQTGVSIVLGCATQTAQ